jgi:hypothetical protein
MPFLWALTVLLRAVWFFCLTILTGRERGVGFLSVVAAELIAANTTSQTHRSQPTPRPVKNPTLANTTSTDKTSLFPTNVVHMYLGPALQ